MKEIRQLLDTITQKNEPVQILKGYKGISTITATTVMAEIIDIRRFTTDDNLVSYSGLCKREYSTGEKKREVANSMFNRRLKDAFMNAPKNFVRFNPDSQDSHLSGYCRNLIKGGMKVTEAYKRVARALARRFFRQLTSPFTRQSKRMRAQMK